MNESNSLLMNSKILVTGANGQLGNEIRKLSINYPGLEFIYTDVDMLDITNPDAVSVFMSACKPAIVINCAAYTAVDAAEKDQNTARKVNALAPQILATACEMHDSFLIHISTDYVFDGEGNEAYTEDAETNPISVYGMTKLEGENNIKMISEKYIIIRTSWLYSTFGHNFVRTMIRLGIEKDSLDVVNDQVGCPTYAHDLADCIIKIIIKTVLNPEAYVPGVYHYTNTGTCTWYEFAKEIHKIYGIDDCELKPIPSTEIQSLAPRPKYSVLDTRKFEQTFDLGLNEWKDSLEKCLSSLK